MKIKLLVGVLIWVCGFQNGICQNPLVKQWDKRFGGSAADWLYGLQQTSDGGYILGGESNSQISGDKTQDTWGVNSWDYWIVKINSFGIKQWDKDFGGNQADELRSFQQTNDGGYILGGYSISGINGDKTEPLCSPGHDDYWIIKIDSLGIKQWDKDFGGTNNDYLRCIQQTADKGYILGGYSLSNSGGNKTQDTQGNFDYWIVKTDSLGNKQWDKDFGGTDADELSFLNQTADGGYILGGYSKSGISGDKTQSVWGIVGFDWDYWIVKTDSLGNKIWDKDFGGIGVDQLMSLVQTTDGGYVLGGISGSGISGDKTQNTFGGFDYWIVKTDSIGNKQWDKDFGGTSNEDEFGNISQTTDGGYLISGTSYSPISGDKTENNLGPEQSWIVETDSLGNKQWDKTLLTNNPSDDESGFAIQTNEGCFVMGNHTQAGVGGDKTQSSRGMDDYWIIKFCDSTLTTSITQLPNTELPFSISPNPATENIYISFPAPSTQTVTKKIYSVTGEVVFAEEDKSTVPITNYQIPISKITNGLYFLSVQTGREVVIKKIVVQH